MRMKVRTSEISQSGVGCPVSADEAERDDHSLRSAGWAVDRPCKVKRGWQKALAGASAMVCFSNSTNATMGGDGDGDGNWTIAGVRVPFWTCISELVR